MKLLVPRLIDPDAPDVSFGKSSSQPTMPEDLKRNLGLAFPLPPEDTDADARFSVLLARLH